MSEYVGQQLEKVTILGLLLSVYEENATFWKVSLREEPLRILYLTNSIDKLASWIDGYEKGVTYGKRHG